MGDVSTAPADAAKRPLVVDLDGTLAKSDFTFESFLQAFKRTPWVVFAALAWLMRGRAYLKSRLYDFGGAQVNPGALPYRDEVRQLIDKAKSSGRRIVLASGSEQRFVDRVAEACGLEGEHFGTSGGVNLTSSRKADRLVRAFPDGFDYVGNSKADLAVWRSAVVAYGTDITPALEQQAKHLPGGLTVLAHRSTTAAPLFKAMRLHQWAKNVLIFTIFAITFPAYGWTPLFDTALGFVLLGLVASGTYIINDLLDIEADRQHPTKRERALASGELQVPAAAGFALLLVVSALTGAFIISPAFSAVLFAYTVLTLSYSFFLKQLAVVDVFCLAALFSLRVIAGGEIIYVDPSPWLLSFMFFFFLALAMAKRVVELDRKRTSVPAAEWGQRIAGRGYSIVDRDFVLAAGIAVSAIAINVFFVYALLADLTLFSDGELAMAAGAILAFWLLRIWYLTNRGALHDDPIYFAIKDKVSLALGAVLLLLVIV